MSRGRNATIVAAAGLASVAFEAVFVADAHSNEGLFAALVLIILTAAVAAAVAARLTAWPAVDRWDQAARVLIAVLGLVAAVTAVVFVSFHCYEGPGSCAPQESTRLFTPVSI